jgi:hypothetical protein
MTAFCASHQQLISTLNKIPMEMFNESKLLWLKVLDWDHMNRRKLKIAKLQVNL